MMQHAKSTALRRPRSNWPRPDRLRRHALGVLLIGCLWFTGCQQKMAAQPNHRPLEPSDFFPDGRSSRQLVPGTVARGHLRTDTHLYTARRSQQGAPSTGAKNGEERTAEQIKRDEAAQVNFVETFPFPMTAGVLEHGYQRFMIYCVVCHDPLGLGYGKIVERGYTPPPSFHIERLRAAPVGHLFAVISEGYGSMPSYGGQIPPRDRWAIAGYIRALQLSQHFPEQDVTAEMRAAWKNQSSSREEPQ